MIGERSGQGAFPPYVLSGSACFRGTGRNRRFSRQRARSPPGARWVTGGSARSGREAAPAADITLGQRLGPAGPASNQAPSEATTEKGVKA
jgi:hypothetical protein